MVTVSVPFDTAGGAPGAMNISTVASQVPTSFLSISCSGPGVGMGGPWARAGTERQRTDTDTTARDFFMAFLRGFPGSLTGTRPETPRVRPGGHPRGCQLQSRSQERSLSHSGVGSK